MYKYNYSMKFVKLILFCLIMLGVSTMIVNNQEREKQESKKNIEVITQTLQDEQKLKEIEQERLKKEEEERQNEQPQEIQEQDEQQRLEQQRLEQEEQQRLAQEQEQQRMAREQAQMYSSQNFDVENLKNQAQNRINYGDYQTAAEMYADIYRSTHSLEDIITLAELSKNVNLIHPAKELIEEHLRNYPQDKESLVRYIDYIKLLEYKERH